MSRNGQGSGRPEGAPDAIDHAQRRAGADALWRVQPGARITGCSSGTTPISASTTFPPGACFPGMTLRQRVELSFAGGNHPGVSLDDLVERHRKRLEANRDPSSPAVFFDEVGDRIIERTYLPSPGLGWVVIHEDVTAQLSREADLEAQHQRLDAALDSMSYGFCLFDAELPPRSLERVFRRPLRPRPERDCPGDDAARSVPREHRRRPSPGLDGRRDGGSRTRAPGLARRRRDPPVGGRPRQRADRPDQVEADGRRLLGDDPRGHHRGTRPDPGAGAAGDGSRAAEHALRGGRQPHVAGPLHVRCAAGADHLQQALRRPLRPAARDGGSRHDADGDPALPHRPRLPAEEWRRGLHPASGSSWSPGGRTRSTRSSCRTGG